MKENKLFLLGCIILPVVERIDASMFSFGGEIAGLSVSVPPDVQVPEPGVLLLLGAGLIVLVILGIKKRKKSGTKGERNPQ